ncbi:hypothetical protein SEMRO_1481_G276270.1 [Seminavis robusta]|uniref:Uncharacterized protein n=1 Tax=Seminavis robusta TaxID=568900 RepID=A0A9N8HSR7_9STRA|nr:hypothetical protein SEMRO_1481_G276270.1 [Seminavis robusta]|eukprot:Sro1481_g276270.1 n/a (671) ;mRNA; f:24222-26234
MSFKRDDNPAYRTDSDDDNSPTRPVMNAKDEYEFYIPSPDPSTEEEENIEKAAASTNSKRKFQDAFGCDEEYLADVLRNLSERKQPKTPTATANTLNSQLEQPTFSQQVVSEPKKSAWKNSAERNHSKTKKKPVIILTKNTIKQQQKKNTKKEKEKRKPKTSSTTKKAPPASTRKQRTVAAATWDSDTDSDSDVVVLDPPPKSASKPKLKPKTSRSATKPKPKTKTAKTPSPEPSLADLKKAAQVTARVKEALLAKDSSTDSSSDDSSDEEDLLKVVMDNNKNGASIARERRFSTQGGGTLNPAAKNVAIPGTAFKNILSAQTGTNLELSHVRKSLDKVTKKIDTTNTKMMSDLGNQIQHTIKLLCALPTDTSNELINKTSRSWRDLGELVRTATSTVEVRIDGLEARIISKMKDTTTDLKRHTTQKCNAVNDAGAGGGSTSTSTTSSGSGSTWGRTLATGDSFIRDTNASFDALNAIVNHLDGQMDRVLSLLQDLQKKCPDHSGSKGTPPPTSIHARTGTTSVTETLGDGTGTYTRNQRNDRRNSTSGSTGGSRYANITVNQYSAQQKPPPKPTPPTFSQVSEAVPFGYPQQRLAEKKASIPPRGQFPGMAEKTAPLYPNNSTAPSTQFNPYKKTGNQTNSEHGNNGATDSGNGPFGKENSPSNYSMDV